MSISLEWLRWEILRRFQTAGDIKWTGIVITNDFTLRLDDLKPVFPAHLKLLHLPLYCQGGLQASSC